jgi:hypothetical protein
MSVKSALLLKLPNACITRSMGAKDWLSPVIIGGLFRTGLDRACLTKVADNLVPTMVVIVHGMVSRAVSLKKKAEMINSIICLTYQIQIIPKLVLTDNC